MDLKQCDVKVCRETVEVDKSHEVNIMGKYYDLCDKCFQKMKAWTDESLENGIEEEQEAPNPAHTITYFPDNGQQPLNIPAHTIPQYVGPPVTITTTDGKTHGSLGLPKEQFLVTCKSPENNAKAISSDEIVASQQMTSYSGFKPTFNYPAGVSGLIQEPVLVMSGMSMGPIFDQED